MSVEPPKARIASSTKGKSNKPQAVKNAVLSRYVTGSSKAAIARDLNLAEATVYRILDECEIRQIVEEGHSRAVQLIPKALDAVEGRLDRGDGRIGISVLTGTGVLRPGGNVTINIANVGAQQWMSLKPQEELNSPSRATSKNESEVSQVD
jgi:CENP-B N-terminal DNA-binding domain